MSATTLTMKTSDIAWLTINNGRGNPLSPDVLDELNEKMDALLENPPKVLLIDTDGASIFSGGFALPIVASWNRKDLLQFFEGFLNIVYKIMSIPCPTITVIEGHAIAGGFILSLATDIRIVKDGNLKFGLSEVDLGVAVPAGAGVLFEKRTSAQSALYYSMTGKLFNPQKALEIGYADVVTKNPKQTAEEVALNFTKKPGTGSAYTRVFCNKRIIKEMKCADNEFMETFLDTWFSEEGQKSIQQMAEKLGKKTK